MTTVATQGALALVEPLHYVPSIEPAAFDYSILPDDVADEARAVAQRVSGRNQRQNDLAFDTGKDLLSIKDRLGHGNWGKWLKAEFNWTERTAQNFMSVAQKFEGKYETVSHLPATTVYALAGPSTPEPLRNQIIERLELGDISAGEIKTILSDAKAEAMQAARDAKRAPKRRRSAAAIQAEKEKAERERHEAEVAKRRGQELAQTVAAMLRERLNDEEFQAVQNAMKRPWELSSAISESLGSKGIPFSMALSNADRGEGA